MTMRKIVIFKPDLKQDSQAAILREVHATIISFLPLINAVGVLLSDTSAEQLRANPHVLSVDDDVLVQAL